MSTLEEKITGERIETMLGTALGAAAATYLSDQTVIELMLNSDGKLWIDRLGEGRSFTGHIIAPKDAERVIYIVASSIKATCSKDSPVLSAELPGTGSRFQGILPPIVAAPSFTIRKKAIKVFTLDDYVSKGIMEAEQAVSIKSAVLEKKNILIAGGTGSGKTTLANAILLEISNTGDRLVIIEDTIELQPTAKDSLSLRTKDGVCNMTDLLKATMRLRPDRIIIGEVRGPEALTLLKGWNTGHPGGCATIHADSARKALSRLSQLIEEAGVSAPKSLIADTVNIIVFIEKTKTSRKVKEVLEVGWSGEDYKLTSIESTVLKAA